MERPLHNFWLQDVFCKLAVRGQEEFPKASDALLSHFYVDDYIG
jgi:hypothetical protein